MKCPASGIFALSRERILFGTQVWCKSYVESELQQMGEAGVREHLVELLQLEHRSRALPEGPRTRDAVQVDHNRPQRLLRGIVDKETDADVAQGLVDGVSSADVDRECEVFEFLARPNIKQRPI